MVNGAPVGFLEVDAAYGRTTVVRQVSLAVEPGSKVAITGSNGSGKSTLVRCLLGLHPTAAGRTLVDGRDARTRAEWRSRRAEVAYVPQRPATGRFPLLVREMLASSGNFAAALEVAEQLDVAPFLARPVHMLSGGQLQRCVLARGIGATRAGARVLVADEPTSALDFDGQDQVAALLGALNVTVVVVTHEQTVVAHCDRVVEMAGGRLREPRR